MSKFSEQVKAIEKFQKLLEQRCEADVKKNYKATHEVEEQKVELQYGRKYCKVVRASYTRHNPPTKIRSYVHCFIEIATGDIYKAATWNAPAKHVRGNINSPDHGMNAVGVYGANYLR